MAQTVYKEQSGEYLKIISPRGEEYLEKRCAEGGGYRRQKTDDRGKKDTAAGAEPSPYKRNRTLLGVPFLLLLP